MIFGIAGSLVGCHEEGESVETPVASKVFDGTPDAKFEGTWKTEDGMSTYQLNKNGTYLLDSKIKVAGNKPINSHLKGMWGIKGSMMEFKDQASNVASYGFELQGNKLTLTSSGVAKAKTIMDRQP